MNRTFVPKSSNSRPHPRVLQRDRSRHAADGGAIHAQRYVCIHVAAARRRLSSVIPSEAEGPRIFLNARHLDFTEGMRSRVARGTSHLRVEDSPSKPSPLFRGELFSLPAPPLPCYAIGYGQHSGQLLTQICPKSPYAPSSCQARLDIGQSPLPKKYF